MSARTTLIPEELDVENGVTADHHRQTIAVTRGWRVRAVSLLFGPDVGDAGTDLRNLEYPFGPVTVLLVVDW